LHSTRTYQDGVAKGVEIKLTHHRHQEHNAPQRDYRICIIPLSAEAINMKKTRKWIVGLVLVFATVVAAGYTYHSVNAQSAGSSNNSQTIGDGHPWP
jgi:hypothetical protein